VLFDTIGILVGIGLGTRFLLFFGRLTQHPDLSLAHGIHHVPEQEFRAATQIDP
jgi:hypothetical protein